MDEKVEYPFGKCKQIHGGRTCRGTLFRTDKYRKHMESVEEYTCENCGDVVIVT